MADKYIYRHAVSNMTDASGISGVLIKTSRGFIFRIYNDDKSFIDYSLNHDDLSITINTDALASFYSCGEMHSLDHSPGVLGLEKADNENH